MTKKINALFADSIQAIKLNILVFGPQVKDMSTDERTLNLQLKRIQIRDELSKDGHNVKYAEDEVDPSLGNMMLQEELIMREFDLIINLVGSPGTIIETGFIARNPEIAQKSQLFMDSDHTVGLVAEGCRLAEELGAFFKEYSYPSDLTDCHLLGFAKERVLKAQKIRYLM
ncbi:hypothetical protein [Hyphomonas sp.]|uniref:hypothetical protein n=1 Tax=Hyphomonas sp. TaxID=87 RepID=UPI003D28DF1C